MVTFRAGPSPKPTAVPAPSLLSPGPTTSRPGDPVHGPSLWMCPCGHFIQGQSHSMSFSVTGFFYPMFSDPSMLLPVPTPRFLILITMHRCPSSVHAFRRHGRSGVSYLPSQSLFPLVCSHFSHCTNSASGLRVSAPRLPPALCPLLPAPYPLLPALNTPTPAPCPLCAFSVCLL